MSYIPASQAQFATAPATPAPVGAQETTPAPSLTALVAALPEQPAAASESIFPRARQVEFLCPLADSGAVRVAS